MDEICKIKSPFNEKKHQFEPVMIGGKPYVVIYDNRMKTRRLFEKNGYTQRLVKI